MNISKLIILRNQFLKLEEEEFLKNNVEQEISH